MTTPEYDAFTRRTLFFLYGVPCAMFVIGVLLWPPIAVMAPLFLPFPLMVHSEWSSDRAMRPARISQFCSEGVTLPCGDTVRIYGSSPEALKASIAGLQERNALHYGKQA